MPLRIAPILSLTAALLPLGCGGIIASGSVIEVADYYQANECARALESANESSAFLAEYPFELAEVQLYKGKCLVRMKRTAEAKATFSYVVDHHPDTPFAYEARVLLEQLEQEPQ